MRVFGRPAGMVEAHTSMGCSFRLQLTSNSSSDPIRVGFGDRQLECRGRLVARHPAMPVEFRAEEETVFGTHARVSRLKPWSTSAPIPLV